MTDKQVIDEHKAFTFCKQSPLPSDNWENWQKCFDVISVFS